MMTFEFTSLFDLQTAFPTEQACINHLENIIWGDVVISPFDATSRSINAREINTVARIQGSISLSKQVLFLIILRLSYKNGLWQSGL